MTLLKHNSTCNRIKQHKLNKELALYSNEAANINLSNIANFIGYTYSSGTNSIESQMSNASTANKPKLDDFRKRLSIKLVENKAANSGIEPKSATKLIKPKNNQPILPTSLKQKIRETKVSTEPSPLI